MKLLVTFCLLFIYIISGEVFTDSDNKKQSFYENLRKQTLPYPLNQEEIDELPESEDKTVKQELHDLMRLSFNVMFHNKNELKSEFVSDVTDLDIINFCRKILSNPDNYKHIKEDYSRQYKSIEKLLNNNDIKISRYVNDIIHNNLYSAVFDVLIEDDKVDSNNFRYMEKEYIIDNIIQQICNKIKNEHRKEIINSVLKTYLLHEIPEGISIVNYNNYLMRTNGIHRDIWDNKTNHIIFHGISFDVFMQIINSLDYDDVKAELENFRKLVQGGYITNPYIVDYINDH